MTQAERVRRMLLPCGDHKRDADWNENYLKQYCDVPGCMVTVCEGCVWQGRIVAGVLWGFCQAHRHAKRRT
jgi:hypothetical protein